MQYPPNEEASKRVFGAGVTPRALRFSEYDENDDYICRWSVVGGQERLMNHIDQASVWPDEDAGG